MTLPPLSLPLSNRIGAPLSPLPSSLGSLNTRGSGVPSANKPKPLTSIAHLHDEDRVSSIAAAQRPKTSIFDRSEPVTSQTDDDEKITEFLREKYIAKKMKEKRLAEAVPTQEQKTAYDVEVKTGKSFRTTGLGGFQRKLGKQIKANRASLGNLSAKDKKFFGDMITAHAKRKMTGQAFTRIDRINMRKEVTEAWKAGSISREDRADFHKMIKGL